jgi:hypothetical protein
LILLRAPTAIDFETYFPAALEQVNIPPEPVPILPISYRFRPGDPVADEVTMVSWIPGLELEMRTPYWAALNEFFVVPLSWHKPFLTLAVSKPLSPQDKSFISQGCRVAAQYSAKSSPMSR